MKEIIALNERFLRDSRGQVPDEGLMLRRRDEPEELEKLPPKTREEIEDLRSRLDQILPDDFDYILCFGDTQPALMLQYHNGSMSAGGRGHRWQETVSIFDQLRKLDWDEERKWAIQGTETFDAIAAVAKELPVMLPLTKSLQKRFSDPVKAYVKEKRRDVSRVHVLLWDGEENLFDQDFVDMKSLEKELPDIMTVMFHVLVVVAQGKPMPSEKIDRMKRLALKQLEDMPISHAKASGKFAYIMAEAQSQPAE
jgi:hypothetical protein